MQPKATGQVPCAHCARAGATASCPSCTRVVCERCRNDWTTCTQPCGRELRLGFGARLTDVSHSGRLGLVQRFGGEVQIVDLRRVRIVATPTMVTRQSKLRRALGEPVQMKLLSGGHVVQEHLEWQTAANGQATARVFRGFERIALPDERLDYVSIPEAWSVLDRQRPQAGTLHVTRDDAWLWYERHDETLRLVELATRASHRVEPLANTVIQSAWLDADGGLLATGVFGAVHLHQFSYGNLLDRSTALVPGADIVAVQLGRGRLLALCSRARGAELRVFDTHSTPGVLGACVYEAEVDGPVAVALSANGRFAAVSRRDDRVELHAIDARRVTILEGHTDTVRLVRFVRNDRELVTADDDNRVIIRPLVDDGYSPRTIEVDLPAEPARFPDLIAEPD